MGKKVTYPRALRGGGPRERHGTAEGKPHAILAEPCLAENDKTWGMLVVKLSPDDHAAVSAPTAAAVLTSATEVEEGNYLRWRPGEKYAPRIIRYHQLPQRSVERRK